tara:strand:+ start:731 stop:1582 length:852 start_codon:yes stop_codon:yes gene_type:complete
MNVKQYVQDLDLSDGDKHRGKCPVCNRHNTFTATNNLGKLLWNCYANSCKISGGSYIHMSVDEIRKRMKGFKIDKDTNTINVELPKVFEIPEYLVPYKAYDGDSNDALIYEFCDGYGLWAADLDLYYDVKENRIVFSVQDNGKIVDAIGRAIDENVLPKWKRYGTYAEGFIRGQHNLAVVVEDVISACVVETLGATGVAILGTSLNANHIEALRSFKRVIVALDPDAAIKTIEYTKLLKANGIPALALKLLDDIKYRKKEDIQFLENTIREFNGTFNTKGIAK